MLLNTDPRNWTPSAIAAFASSCEPEELEEAIRRVLSFTQPEALAILEGLLSTAHGNTFLKPVPSQYASRALVALGPPGIDVLMGRLLDQGTRVRYTSLVIKTLWDVSQKGAMCSTDARTPRGLLDLDLPVGTQRAAERAIHDLFAEALGNPYALSLITDFLHHEALLSTDPDSPSDASAIISIFADASIKLTRSLLRDFETLLQRKSKEEVYQSFLSAHPVLLDPLAAEVIPKQRLGLEFCSDYALRTHDGRWLLVEIERPYDPLFSQNGDMRQRLVHAIGQVLDFIHWVDTNVAYAQRHMPGIAAPRGLVVMGLRSGLTARQQTRLQQFTDNSRRVDVATFDDLLARSRLLYANLHAVGDGTASDR